MYCVYILYSQSSNKFYVGISSNLSRRISEHNHKHTYWTSRANDWAEIWCTETENVLSARDLEKKIKSRGAKRFLFDLGVAVPPIAV